jgi:light-regulated signal transduction histidine kinase (bacteriophytochrome)
LKKKYESQLDETANKYIHFAVDGADRMKTLISVLLNFSRAGTAKEGFKTFDLNLSLGLVIASLEQSILETGVKLEIAELPVITGEESQIRQLFQNLISNAIKYRKEANPLVEIGFRENEKEWEFYVKDNGIGFDRMYADKVFVIFQRLHSKNEYSGTGIGLAICKKIVDRHGGLIWVDSIPGTGSTFYFTIPKNF